MSVTTPGLPLPNLDDRRWTDLVEEGRSLIPLYAPEWTDHNASDPGITLIELLAWLAEQQVFRTDRLGQAGLVKLLKLAGGVAAPPRPARAVLSVSTANGHPSATVAAETEFEGNTPDGDPVRFRTLEDTVVAEATLGAFQIQNGEAFLDRTSALSHQQWVAAWGDSPGPGSVFVLGFTKALPADAEVFLYFVVRDPDESDAERARLVKEFGESGATNHHSVRLVWEAWAGPGLWVPLEARDETRALTLNGRVRLTGSDLMADTVLGRVESKFFYVRARIVSGRHDAAPRLRAVIANAVVVEQAVVPGAARKAKQPTGDGVPAGRLFEPLASGDGWPGQVRSVSSPSVAIGDIVVLSPDGSGWKPWQRKDDFDASRRTSSDFVLDAALGQIRFGDGEHGRTPPDGEQLYAS
jgi:predicted phage baseplate assembly protein